MPELRPGEGTRFVSSAGKLTIYPGFTPEEFGAVGDQTADDSLPILNMANAATGNIARIPVGDYRADATRILPVLADIRGAGSGEGPGAIATSNVTRIIANFTAGHIWDFAPATSG